MQVKCRGRNWEARTQKASGAPRNAPFLSVRAAVSLCRVGWAMCVSRSVETRMALSDKTAALAKQWLEWDYNPVTHAEIQKLVDEKNEAELAKRLHHRIDFGTAGALPFSPLLFPLSLLFPSLCVPLSLFFRLTHLFMLYRSPWRHESWFFQHERLDCRTGLPGASFPLPAAFCYYPICAIAKELAKIAAHCTCRPLSPRDFVFGHKASRTHSYRLSAVCLPLHHSSVAPLHGTRTLESCLTC